MQASFTDAEKWRNSGKPVADPSKVKKHKKRSVARARRAHGLKRQCASKWYVEDVSKGLYLLKAELKDIDNSLQLTDSAVVFFTRLMWFQFGRFKVISSAEIYVDHESLLERDVEHAQILHDEDRSHWVVLSSSMPGRSTHT